MSFPPKSNNPQYGRMDDCHDGDALGYNFHVYPAYRSRLCQQTNSILFLPLKYTEAIVCL